jgi:hypothetical protein
VLDLGSRRLLGYSMADHMRTELVADALTLAAGVRGGATDGVIFHGDGTGKATVRSRSASRSDSQRRCLHPGVGGRVVDLCGYRRTALTFMNSGRSAQRLNATTASLPDDQRKPLPQRRTLSALYRRIRRQRPTSRRVLRRPTPSGRSSLGNRWMSGT